MKTEGFIVIVFRHRIFEYMKGFDMYDFLTIEYLYKFISKIFHMRIRLGHLHAFTFLGKRGLSQKHIASLIDIVKTP